MDKIEIRFGQRVKEIRLKQNISLKSIEKIAEGFRINIKDLFEFK